jgi:hypothetical protein
MAVNDKALQTLMSNSHSTVAAGEPIDLQALVSDLVTSGAFFEPFWDPPEQYRDDGTPLDPEGSATYSPNPWDCVQLGEYQLPGIWTASATPAIKLDVQKPIGYDGAALITRGYLPASITLTGLLWTGMQWRLMQEIIPAIWRRPNKISAQDVQLGKKGRISEVETDQGEIVIEQKSLAIVNPALNPLGLFAVVIRQITPLVPHSIPGVRQMTIECMEYVPEPTQEKKSAVRKAKGKETARGQNAIDKAIAEKDARKPKPPSTRKEALEP